MTIDQRGRAQKADQMLSSQLYDLNTALNRKSEISEGFLKEENNLSHILKRSEALFGDSVLGCSLACSEISGSKSFV